jgi:outer membrane lipoprotein carrier protein
MPRHRGGRAAAAAALLLCVSAPAAAAEPPADEPAAGDPAAAAAFEELQKAHADLVELSADFVHTKEVPLFDERITSSGRLYYRKPDKLLLQYTEPDSSRVLIDGGTIWLYYPALEQAHRYAVDPEVALPGVFLGFGGSSEGVEERFDVETTPPDREKGFITDRIILKPRPGTELADEVRSIELVIRRESHLPVRCEFWEVSGDHTLFEFSSYDVNPRLDPALFVFTPPEGTEVFEVEGETW